MSTLSEHQVAKLENLADAVTLVTLAKQELAKAEADQVLAIKRAELSGALMRLGDEPITVEAASQGFLVTMVRQDPEGQGPVEFIVSRKVGE